MQPWRFARVGTFAAIGAVTALVVGASSGLGRALASELARRGRDLLEATQGEIVILRPLEADAEAAYLPNECGPVNPQVRDEVLPEEKLRVPIGFEIGIGAAALAIELVFVAIEKIDRAIFRQFPRHQK